MAVAETSAARASEAMEVDSDDSDIEEVIHVDVARLTQKAVDEWKDGECEELHLVSSNARKAFDSSLLEQLLQKIKANTVLYGCIEGPPIEIVTKNLVIEEGRWFTARNPSILLNLKSVEVRRSLMTAKNLKNFLNAWRLGGNSNLEVALFELNPNVELLLEDFLPDGTMRFGQKGTEKHRDRYYFNADYLPNANSKPNGSGSLSLSENNGLWTAQKINERGIDLGYAYDFRRESDGTLASVLYTRAQLIFVAWKNKPFRVDNIVRLLRKECEWNQELVRRLQPLPGSERVEIVYREGIIARIQGETKRTRELIDEIEREKTMV